MSARLSATKLMQALSDISDTVARRIALGQSSNTVKWSRSAPDAAPKKLSACDLRKFLEIFREEVLSLATYTGNPGPGTPEAPSLSWIFKKYFAAWVDGSFVDRNGKQYSEPHLKDTIPNDVIAAPLALFLEAFFDLKLNYPILVGGDESDPIYYPAGNKNRPTAATLQIENVPVIPTVGIVDEDTHCGITRREAKAIGFASKLAASSSAMGSGLVLEAFGDVEIAFVIGGNFSVGDSETFATLVKTLFEAVSRRVTEREMYDLFYTYPTRVENKPVSKHKPHQAHAESDHEGNIRTFLSDFE
jgi:hypothetical protein